MPLDILGLLKLCIVYIVGAKYINRILRRETVAKVAFMGLGVMGSCYDFSSLLLNLKK